MTLNILGSDWEIVFANEDDDLALKDTDGYTDSSIKRITVDDMSKHDGDLLGKKDMEAYKKQVLRHEIVHAFLCESGLDGNGSSADHWEHCEEIVDWIAIQGPKIYRVWHEVGAV